MRINPRAAGACALGALLLAGSGARAGQPAAVRVRDTAAFTVVEAPAQPVDVYENALRFAPSLSTGSYLHAGAEYGLVVAGRIARTDAGRTRMLAPGASFVSAPGEVSESRVSRGAVQLSVFLQPRGVPPPVRRAALIYQHRFPAAPPRAPFTLVEQLLDLPAGSSTRRFAYGGAAYCMEAQGEFAVEKDGIITRYRLGEAFTAAAGQSVRFINDGKRQASVHIVVLLPEAVHFTLPARAY